MSLQTNMVTMLLAGPLSDADHSPAESIVYRPTGADARTINAIVFREQFEGYQNTSAPVTAILVANHATSGITAAELNKGLDQVDVAERAGESATTRNIGQILKQSTAYLKLEIR